MGKRCQKTKFIYRLGLRFTVSPLALHNFEQKYGYALTAEDFVNQGKYQVTHMPPTKAKKDWMEFINDFVISFGKKTNRYCA